MSKCCEEVVDLIKLIILVCWYNILLDVKRI